MFYRKVFYLIFVIIKSEKTEEKERRKKYGNTNTFNTQRSSIDHWSTIQNWIGTYDWTYYF